jgi:3-hydroxyisobutyrate dehydrogenase-like beta-hydroxyacid dehydrogenase
MTGKVGFIGLGDQGGPMAAAIAPAFDLQVWARRPASYAPLLGPPYSVAKDANDLAASVSVLCLCLPGDTQLAELLQSAVIGAMKPGSIVINHATGDPEAAAGFAAELASGGIDYLDAPVSGGRPGAVARTLTTFVGGDAAVLEACWGILATYSNAIHHMGPAGAGQMTKLLNNALTVSNLRNVVEVLTLAEAAGMSPPALQAALRSSSGGSFILQALGTKITPDNADHIAGLNRKDVAEFAEAMQRKGLHPEAIVNWAMPAPNQLAAKVRRLANASH